MDIVVASAAFLVALLCAGTMGFAIQRGATCTVAAVDELVRERGVRRLAALLEAALWVAGGLLVAQQLQVLPKMPAGYAVGPWTVLGGALLGLGAYVNRACVFGAIARFGSGEWAYLVTPLGFYVGCVSVGHVFAAPVPRALPYGSPVLQASAWVALLFAAGALWRLGRPLLAGVRAGRPAAMLAARAWSPHTATTIIGVTFVVLLLLVGSWAYTDVLVELARGMAGSLVARCLLLLALLLGAALGGWTAGRYRNTRIGGAQVLRCFVGGLLMGWGSLLIPGGNDGLILVGMPLLWPYAWIAFATMCVTIAAAMFVGRRHAAPAEGRGAS
jgi:toxin CptA